MSCYENLIKDLDNRIDETLYLLLNQKITDKKIECLNKNYLLHLLERNKETLKKEFKKLLKEVITENQELVKAHISAVLFSDSMLDDLTEKIRQRRWSLW